MAAPFTKTVDCTTPAGTPLRALGQLAGQTGACQLNNLRQGQGGFWKAQGDAPATAAAPGQATPNTRPLGILRNNSYITIQGCPTSVIGNAQITTPNPNVTVQSSVIRGGPQQYGINCQVGVTPAFFLISPTSAIYGGGGNGGQGSIPSQTVVVNPGTPGMAGIRSSGTLSVTNNGTIYAGSKGGNGGLGQGGGSGGGGGGGGWPNGVAGGGGDGGGGTYNGQAGQAGPNAQPGVNPSGVVTTSPTAYGPTYGGGGGLAGAGGTNFNGSAGNAGQNGQPFQTNPGAPVAVTGQTIQWVVIGTHN